MIVPQLMESTSLEAVKYFDMMASLLAKNIAFDEFYNANKNDPMFPFSKSLTSYDDVIADIEHFTGPLEKEASLLFIHGPDSQAPSISILAYAVAKQMKANKLLGASFFFPTPGFLEFPLIGPSTLILTIAYQLGIKFPILQPYIVQGAISSSASSLSRQLEELIAKPALVLRNMNIAQKQIIVINGLDYCPESSQSHLRSVVQLHLRSAIESLHRCISNNDLPLAVLLFGGDSSKDALKKDPSSAEIDLYFVTGEGKGPGPQFKQVFSSLTPLAGDVWSLLSHFTIYGENLRTPSLQLPIASLIMQLLELGPDDLSACLLTLQPLFPLPCQSLDTLWQTQAELRLIWSPWLTKFLKNYRRTKIHRSTGSKIDILLLKLCIKIITNNLKEHSHMGVYCNLVLYMPLECVHDIGDLQKGKTELEPNRRHTSLTDYSTSSSQKQITFLQISKTVYSLAATSIFKVDIHSLRHFQVRRRISFTRNYSTITFAIRHIRLSSGYGEKYENVHPQRVFHLSSRCFFSPNQYLEFPYNF
ncbi:hypothetical protein BDQ12DRAFT_450872 [Crucibulum laeve]|uniref:Uncharacterized protein n=1 Tax=Crucibulum laeve TaxID=68775 RepID=A0A5C3LJH6_9AGAR|nr:hypothetical protein BDQ12DRAFT_450872 [Crucibulum laeve]